MGAGDFQFGVKKESSFGTPVTVDRFFEYSGDVMPVRPIPGRTEGTPLRVGSRARRASRVVPYTDHCEGTVELDVMSKGFGFWLEHMLPSVATTGAGPYTHTATEGTSSSALVGKSFTAQFNAPLHPAGTNQPMTFAGGKIPSWTLGCDVDGMLVLSLDLWFASFATDTALATASYPSSMKNFAWSHGVVSVGGSAFDITSFSVEVNQGGQTDRKQIRGNSAPKEPTPGRLEISWSLEADFDSLTQFNRVHDTDVADLSAAIVATFTNGTDIIAVTIPSARFDEFDFSGEEFGLAQSLSGVGEYDGTNSPITIAYTTADSTP